MTIPLPRTDHHHRHNEQFQAPAISLAVAGGSLVAGLAGWIGNLLHPGSSSLDALLLVAAAFLGQGLIGYLKSPACRKGFSVTPGLPASHLPAMRLPRLSQARWN